MINQLSAISHYTARRTIQCVAIAGANCITVASPFEHGNYFLDSGVGSYVCEVALATNATSAGGVIDFGAGVGQYADIISPCGISWRGYDAAANTEAATRRRVRWLDVSAPAWVGAGAWVIAINVFPAAHLEVFLDNVARHARVGAILTSPQRDEAASLSMRELMTARGFVVDESGTATLRLRAEKEWLRKSLVVFTRVGSTASGNAHIRGADGGPAVRCVATPLRPGRRARVGAC